MLSLQWMLNILAVREFIKRTPIKVDLIANGNDMKIANHDAAIPNPALKSFSALVGEWETVGTHPKLPGITLHGYASFNWMEGGAFLVMHSKINEGKIPTSIAIFGSDNSKGEYFMLYFDERKVSRKCDVVFQDNVLKWWRNAPEFSQRYTFTFTDNGNTIISKGEKSENGTTWEQDLDLTYTRVKQKIAVMDKKN
jgi:hypothetical protein